MKFIQNIFKDPLKYNQHNAKQSNQKCHFDKISQNKQSTKSETYSHKTHSLDDSHNNSHYLAKIISIKLSKTDIVQKNKSQKAHMTYEMTITTSQFQYSLRKRFSLFNDFYLSIRSQIEHLHIQFPKKTFLISGMNIDIVTQRYQLLNVFLQKLFNELKLMNEDDREHLVKKFLQFIEIVEQYQRRNVRSYHHNKTNECNHNNMKIDMMCRFTSMKDLNRVDGEEFNVEDVEVGWEIRKLNHNYCHQDEILKRIAAYVKYKHFKLTNDEIRMILVGGQGKQHESQMMQTKGILTLSFTINNQIKALGLLKFILSYLKSQNHTYNEKIFRQFQKLPLEIFNFKYEKVRSNFNLIEFKKYFFQLVELYCQNKLIKENKILQKYPELRQEFNGWKNLYEFNDGKGKKCHHHQNNQNGQYLDVMLQKNTTLQEKTKSFDLQNNFQHTFQTLRPLKSAGNLQLFKMNENDRAKSSFKSYNSTSELTIEEEWQQNQNKDEQNNLNIHENSFEELFYQQDTFSTLKQVLNATIKSNKQNKIKIQLNNVTKTMQQCEGVSSLWNKLIYDQRHDPFTQISRIYMKLNGKSKIFKFKQDDEKVEKCDHKNIIRIHKKRLESHNSVGKAEKQNNLQEFFKLKASDHANGFEQIITIENLQQNEQKIRRVTVQMNFEGEQDYFKSEIIGSTTHMFDCLLKAFY